MIDTMNWPQVEKYLGRDDRAVVPLGSTEQHAYLSLCVDNILAERVAREAAEPLNVPVFPVLAYGVTPYFLAYPGTVSLRLETYLHILTDILNSLAGTGFKRVLFVNGHGGNSAASTLLQEWINEHEGVQVKWHNWWNAPKTLAKVREIDNKASHASWMEAFAWTRLEGVSSPDTQKPMVDTEAMRLLSAAGVREMLGDGSFGGRYERPDEQMDEVWRVGVEEVREALEGPWR